MLQKEAENKAKQMTYNRYVAEKERLTKIAEAQRQQAKKLEKSKKGKQQNNKSNFGGRLGHQSSVGSKEMKLARKAKDAESKILNMAKAEPPEKEYTINFKKSKALELHNPYPIIGEKICKSFGELVLFDNAQFSLQLNSKAALTGPNGCGKTTLFHMILEKESCIKLSPKAVFGVYSQTVYKCQQRETVMEYLLECCEYNSSEIRGALINMGFDENAYRKNLYCLSGGELVKIKLLSLLMGRYNILLLDEPSNYFDTVSVNALEKMIKDYQGTVLFISHDINFINNTATTIYEITNHKIVQVKSTHF